MALRQSSVERSAMASTARTCAGTVCGDAPECHCQRGIASPPRLRRPDECGAYNLHRFDHQASEQTHIRIVASRYKRSGASDFGNAVAAKISSSSKSDAKDQDSAGNKNGWEYVIEKQLNGTMLTFYAKR